MASTVTVFETAARRTVIKVSPGKYLYEVRAEACEKFRLDSDKYGLKHSNKTLDLSSQFRVSGLPSGAKLELVQLSRSAGVVNVAIQLPQSEAQGAAGGRLSDKFPSTTTLWQVLRKFEDGVAGGSRSRNLTARGVPKMASGEAGAGRLYYEQPVMTLMNREYASFVDLQKTLSSLGLSSGSVLIRLAYRASDQPLEQAQEQIGRYFEEIEGSKMETEVSRKELEQEQAKQPPTTSLQSTNSTAILPESSSNQSSNAVTSAHTDEGSQMTVENPEPAPVAIDGVSQRPIKVFSAPSNSTPKAVSASYNPADYEFTVDHAKTQAAMYQAAGRNKPLPSDAEVEAQKAEAVAKIAAIRSVQIKVRFPDQTTVVSDFDQQDAGRDLYGWTQGLMQNGDAPFSLRWAGPKGMTDVPNDGKKLISEIGMTGRVQVSLAWKEGADMDVRRGPVLKDRVNQIAREIEVRDNSNVSGPQSSPEVKNTGGQVQGERKKAALPAWLKKSLPGKK